MAELSPSLLGLLAGAVLSVIPWELALVIAAILIVLCVIRLRRGSRSTATAYLVGAALGLAVLVVAALLPVKQLDRTVGPMHYESMPLDQLTLALARDWRVLVMPDRLASTNPIAAFSTRQPMSRREVLQKLAAETGGELHIGYCGTGATLLFGAHPSFTRLKMAQQDGAANGSQPIRSETTRTSSAAGSRR